MRGDGWDGILHPDERVVWPGQPSAMPHFRIRDPMEFGLGLSLAFGPVAPTTILWIGGGPEWLFFLPSFALGAWFIAGWCLWEAWCRRRTWYSLTDRRAFVATAVMGRRRLRAIPLGPAPSHDGRSPGSLDFAAPDGA